MKQNDLSLLGLLQLAFNSVYVDLINSQVVHLHPITQTGREIFFQCSKLTFHIVNQID